MEIDLLAGFRSQKTYAHREDNGTDVKALKGKLARNYRIRKGSIRIIFRYTQDKLIIINIVNIDFRGNIYDT
jgi:mRNA-degrading endonuclease RelE of RelBE toxin-antitoxin system